MIDTTDPTIAGVSGATYSSAVTFSYTATDKHLDPDKVTPFWLDTREVETINEGTENEYIKVLAWKVFDAAGGMGEKQMNI